MVVAGATAEDGKVVKPSDVRRNSVKLKLPGMVVPPKPTADVAVEPTGETTGEDVAAEENVDVDEGNELVGEEEAVEPAAE
jgi:hypothetical protein